MHSPPQRLPPILVLVVSMCCANEPSQCLVLRLGTSQPASFAFFCIMWFLERGRAHKAPGPTPRALTAPATLATPGVPSHTPVFWGLSPGAWVLSPESRPPSDRCSFSYIFHTLSPHNTSSRGNWKPTGQLVSSCS